MHPFGPWYLLVLVPLVVRNAWLLTPFGNSQPLELVDVPQSTDHYMEPAQHGVQDVLNISTEVHVFHRARLDLDHARPEKDHARLEKDHPRLEKDHARLDLDHEVSKNDQDFSFLLDWPILHVPATVLMD